VKLGTTITSFQADDILFFETKESLSFLVHSKGNHYPIDYTLDELETMLSPKDFFRINRKVIIHIKSIEKVDTYFNGRLCIQSKLLEGEERIVSRERVNDFKLWLDS
jgi:DNA-binding LytR/AlgR family response regulator